MQLSVHYIKWLCNYSCNKWVRMVTGTGPQDNGRTGRLQPTHRRSCKLPSLCINRKNCRGNCQRRPCWLSATLCCYREAQKRKAHRQGGTERLWVRTQPTLISGILDSLSNRTAPRCLSPTGTLWFSAIQAFLEDSWHHWGRTKHRRV